MTKLKVTFNYNENIRQQIELIGNNDFCFYNETECFFENHNNCDCKMRVCTFSCYDSNFYLNNHLFTNDLTIKNIIAKIQENEHILQTHDDFIKSMQKYKNNFFMHAHVYGWVFKYPTSNNIYTIEKNKTLSICKYGLDIIALEDLPIIFDQHLDNNILCNAMSKINITENLVVEEPYIYKLSQKRQQVMWIHKPKHERMSIQACKKYNENLQLILDS